ncbi:endospore germination permease [Clostridium tetanomorphum]|uniref:endospore germination permease n=1 Tax=Clostridium tetanomorphum TaxID=1553 RepID=UPI001570433C|nr:endospore germination permease [Clostridium tetanomorphum]NRZ95911.1 spore germination protein (amino acid permease) [Clostridium tetanomorphum]
MNKITSKQFVFLIFAITIVSLKTYPSILIFDSGRDTWISVIISSIIAFLYFLFCLKVFQKTNSYDLHYIYCNSVGKFFGNIFFFIFILGLFLTLIECAGVESNSMHTNLLLETPVWYLLIFLIFPAIYVVRKGNRSILSVAIIGMILMILAGINLAILTSSYKHYSYLLPIFENGITKGFIASILKSLGLYAHVTISFLYIDRVHKKDKLLKHSLLGFLFVIQMEIIAMTGVLSTFQADRAVRLIYPKLVQTQLISYWKFLESGELFVMLQTIGGWYVKYILILDCTIKCLKNINIKNKYIIYLISILAFITTAYIADDLLYLLKFLSIYTYICLINFLLYLVYLYLYFILNIKKL